MEPFAYLSDILSRLPDHPINMIAELLLQNWRTPNSRDWALSQSQEVLPFDIPLILPLNLGSSFPLPRFSSPGRIAFSQKILPNYSAIAGIAIPVLSQAGLCKIERRKNSKMHLPWPRFQDALTEWILICNLDFISLTCNASAASFSLPGFPS